MFSNTQFLVQGSSRLAGFSCNKGVMLLLYYLVVLEPM